MEGSLIPLLSEQYALQFDFAVKVIECTLSELDLELGGDGKDERDEFEKLVDGIALKLLGKRPRIKKAKKVKDPKEPKKPLSAYLIYSQEQRPILKKKFPNFKPNEIMVRIGEQWKKLSDAEKVPYELARDKEVSIYKEKKRKYDNGELGDDEVEEEQAENSKAN